MTPHRDGWASRRTGATAAVLVQRPVHSQARTCRPPVTVTRLCRFHCGVADVCTPLSALYRFKCFYTNAFCYPHMPIRKVWIYRFLFVCLFVILCVFVRLRISLARIKLAASNFARWFTGVPGRESPILGNFAPQKEAPPEAKNRTNRSVYFFRPPTETPR